MCGQVSLKGRTSMLTASIDDKLGSVVFLKSIFGCQVETNRNIRRRCLKV